MSLPQQLIEAQDAVKEMRSLLAEVAEAGRIVREIKLEHTLNAKAKIGNRRATVETIPFVHEGNSRVASLAWVLANNFTMLLASESMTQATAGLEAEELRDFIAIFCEKILIEQRIIPLDERGCHAASE